jgi:hypothetical protein
MAVSAVRTAAPENCFVAICIYQKKIIQASYNYDWLAEVTPCFPHFLKTSSESIDFTALIFENGCPEGYI